MPRKTETSKKITTGGKSKHSHPKYEVMVADAIRSLDNRTGSSFLAIEKYISNKCDVPEESRFKPILRHQLKRLVDKKFLKKNKASYKLVTKDKVKKLKDAKETKPKIKPKPKTVKKRSAPSTTKSEKKPVTKKPKTPKPKTTKPKTTKPKTTKPTTKPRKSAKVMKEEKPLRTSQRILAAK